jgi:hypothetical protein
MQKHSYLYNQGYRFYVYIGPGNINYYFDHDQAKIFADANGVEVKDLD